MVIYEHGSWRSRWSRLWKRLFHIIGPNLSVRRTVNILTMAADRAFLRPQVRGRPFTMYLEISSVCNLRCPGCLSHDKSYHARLMPLEEFWQILDHYAPYLVDLELYGWGEPFLNKQIFDMIRYAKRCCLFVRTSSNFNCFEPGDHERIVRSGLDQINASIDGVSPDTYEQYRIGGSLEVALDNLRKLIETRKRLGAKRPIVEWQFIVSRINYKEIESVKKLATETGVDILRLDLPFSLPHIDEVNDPTAELRWLADDPDFRQWANTFRPDAYACARACSYLWSSLQVDAEGQVNPCPNRIGSKVQCGLATSRPLRDIWNQALFVEGRKLFAAKPEAPPSFHGPCRECKEGMQPWKAIWPELVDVSPERHENIKQLDCPPKIRPRDAS